MAVFYHLDRKNVLKPNLELRLHRIDTRGEAAAAHLTEMFPDGISLHGLYAIGWGKPGPVLRREHVLEMVRQDDYPRLPSRFTRLFACETLEGAMRLRSGELGGQDGWRDSAIWKVMSSDAFRADMNWFSYGNLANIEQIAHHYWRQESSPTPFWEIMLGLPAVIMDRIA